MTIFWIFFCSFFYKKLLCSSVTTIFFLVSSVWNLNVRKHFQEICFSAEWFLRFSQSYLSCLEFLGVLQPFFPLECSFFIVMLCL